MEPEPTWEEPTSCWLASAIILASSSSSGGSSTKSSTSPNDILRIESSSVLYSQLPWPATVTKRSLSPSHPVTTTSTSSFVPVPPQRSKRRSSSNSESSTVTSRPLERLIVICSLPFIRLRSPKEMPVTCTPSGAREASMPVCAAVRVENPKIIVDKQIVLIFQKITKNFNKF